MENKRLIFLGDIHGNFSLIHQYVKRFDIKNANIIQVGDFGVGFKSLEKDKRNLELYHRILVKNNVFLYVIRGNHDYKPYFDNDPFGFTNIKLVSDYEVLELSGQRILFIGGAISVDRKYRTEGYDWWPDEVFHLDTKKLFNYRNIDIVVTHTAPDYCPPDNGNGFGFISNMVKETDGLKEDLLFERYQMKQAFSILKDNNDIKFHYYGHFHFKDYTMIQGTKHRVLGIGEFWEERDYYV